MEGSNTVMFKYICTHSHICSLKHGTCHHHICTCSHLSKLQCQLYIDTYAHDHVQYMFAHMYALTYM